MQSQLGPVWVLCFVMYVVVLAEAHPDLANSCIVYLALIMVVASGDGGDGWVTCDSFFCHNVQ